jgi:putative PEP-CTERM system histidine kinase
MDHYIALAFVTMVSSVAVGVAALYKNPRSLHHRVFAAGMLVLALDALTIGMSVSPSTEQFAFWTMANQVVESFLFGTWLLFSIIFARSNYSELLSRWKWIIALSFLAPIVMILVFQESFFTGRIIAAKTGFIVPLGWSGYLWHLCAVVLSIMIIMNLERTLRHSTGHTRWQIKFMLLGIGGIFLVKLFIDSQYVLFHSIQTELDILNVGAILVANILVSGSLFRGNPLEVSVYLSHKFLYNSLTVLIIGIYFILVATLSWLSYKIGSLANINIVIFVIFLGVIGMGAFLLSDRMRLKRKRFISHNFKRPIYDYQNIWETFTEQTASVTNVADLCGEVVKLISKSLEILSVTIWLVDEKQETLSFGGSTVLTAAQAGKVKFAGGKGDKLILAMADQEMPVDLGQHEDDWVSDLVESYEDETKEGRIRYCVPMRASGRLVGIMTLSSKVYYESLSFEDSELLKTLADQAAALLLNLELSERVRQAREMEAFQNMSAFFIHDLKNLANKLSLVTQNLPKYLDNPEFRADALRTISQSVQKINTMSGRLSLVSQKLDLQLRESDLKAFIEQCLSALNGFMKTPVRAELAEVPPVLMDQSEMKKVLDNLLINAQEAGENGGIVVRTGQSDKWVEFSVTDSGCGMKREFVERQLFRPFQTTKQKGMGIGLFHCKTIVEGHGGRIEVETEEGKGSTFRVLLPAR